MHCYICWYCCPSLSSFVRKSNSPVSEHRCSGLTQFYFKFINSQKSYLFLCVNLPHVYFPGEKIFDPTVYVGKTGEITYLSEHDQSRNSLDHPICGSVDGTMSSDYLFTCTEPLLGRYVFVDSYSNGNDHRLSLAEVEVFIKHCDSNNWAGAEKNLYYIC